MEMWGCRDWRKERKVKKENVCSDTTCDLSLRPVWNCHFTFILLNILNIPQRNCHFVSPQILVHWTEEEIVKKMSIIVIREILTDEQRRRNHFQLSIYSLRSAHNSLIHVIGVVWLMLSIFPPSYLERLKYNTSPIQICLIFHQHLVSRRAVKHQMGSGDMSSLNNVFQKNTIHSSLQVQLHMADNERKFHLPLHHDNSVSGYPDSLISPPSQQMTPPHPPNHDGTISTLMWSAQKESRLRRSPWEKQQV